MKELILNLLPLTEEDRQNFEHAAPDCEQRFVPCMDFYGKMIPFQRPELLSDATVLLGNLPSSMLSTAKRLRWMQTWSAGTDAFLPDGVLPEHAMLTSAVGAYGPSVSEHMFAMLLTLIKHLHLYRDDRAWRDCDHGQVRGFAGLRVLIAGAGDIGLAFAGLCKSVGMYTVGLKRTAADCPSALDEVHLLSELDAWLPWADAVFLALPQTPETVRLMDARRMALMRPGALLLNGGRGSAVDAQALSTALSTGVLGGAGLDVTEPEPLPEDHPLWSLPNCFLTPHVAGGLHLAGTREKIVSIALENLKRYLGGEPLHNRMK